MPEKTNEMVTPNGATEASEVAQAGDATPTTVAAPRLFDNATPESVVKRAHEKHGPFVHRVCLFSGGNDSMGVAYRCRDMYDTLVWVNTGTAVPGVEEFVYRAAEWLNKPLRVYSAPEGEYRRIVLGGGMKRCSCRGKGCEKCGGTCEVPREALGFPGPAQHTRCYTNLKERAIEQMVREVKAEFGSGDRMDRVLALTGIRRAESVRRRQREEITKRGALVFCNPLIDWTGRDLLEYRHANGVIESDVAALLHRSGECNCGAFAAPGEREELKSLFPEWFAEFIEPLELEAVARGQVYCKWGAGRTDLSKLEEAGPMCSDCQLRIEDGVVAAGVR